MQATFLTLLPTHGLATVSAFDSFLLLSTAPAPRASPLTQVPQVPTVMQVPQVPQVSPVGHVGQASQVSQVSPVSQTSQVPQVTPPTQVSQVPQVQVSQMSEESVLSDRQRFASTLFSLCKEMAFKAAKSILSAKKVGAWGAPNAQLILFVLQGSFAPKFGHHIVLQLCSNLLLRMQCASAPRVSRRFGSKQPAFPLTMVESILLESGVKLGDVTIFVNESCLFSKGVLAKEYKELCEEELGKSELR